MKPEEITEANWAQAMESMSTEPSTLTSSVRENLDQPTQHVLRMLRERAPRMPSPRVTINGEEPSNV